MDTLVSVVAFFIVFGSILFLAYVTTKYIGNKTNRIMKGKHISVMETVSLGFDSRLHLVKVGNDMILISCSGKNIQLLKTIELDVKQEDINTHNSSISSFSHTLNKYLNKLKEKKQWFIYK
ncbi:UNVERIFIED_CONTAM: flagellar protein FliO/FliZ [Acetivibrio alkalicellulosi]